MNFAGPVPGVPDATINIVAELPDRIPNAQHAGLYIQAAADQLLIVMPGVARYLVRNGTTIDVAPDENADPGAVAIYLYGSARAALIHQRGELPLHAASLVPPDHTSAIAICGASGLGKSTLAAELCLRGWTLVADDTTRIVWTGTQALAWPSHDSIKLWRDAAERVGADTAKLERVREGMEKYFLPTPTRKEPAPLATVIELVLGEGSGMRELSGLDKIDLLTKHTFRPRQIKPLGRLGDHMRIVSRIAGATRQFQLSGARSHAPGELAAVIEAHLR